MRNYDYKKAIEIMQREGAKKASLGISEDWFWTAEEVTISKLKKMKNGITEIAGITGSYWATPVIRIDIEDGVKEFDCYYTK